MSWNRRKLFAIFMALLSVALIVPFFTPVLMGFILAVWLEKPFLYLNSNGISKSWSCTLVVGLFLLLFFIPTALLTISAVQSAGRIAPQIHSYITQLLESETGPWEQALTTVNQYIPNFGIEMSQLKSTVNSLSKSFAIQAAQKMGNLAGLLPSLFLSILFTILSLVYFLPTMPQVKEYFQIGLRFSKENVDHIFKKLYQVCHSVFFASLVVGVVQGLIFGIACSAVGFGDGLILGFAVFVFSFIPLIGGTPITLTWTLFCFMQKGSGPGLTLLVSAIILGGIDNIIRPLILRSGASLHPLLAFVSATGVVIFFGFPGLFLGPIIYVMTKEFFKISWGKQSEIKS